MDVTTRLLRVYQIDRQLAGLQSRLRAAERFFNEQTKQLAALDAKHVALVKQVKQISASVANAENDVRSTNDRLETIREQMDKARTTKDYQTFLNEVNSLKADKAKVEEDALGQMTRADELKAELAELDTQRAERAKMRGVAETQCKDRKAEIADKLEQLTKERVEAVEEVPANVLSDYERLYEHREEDTMAPMEIADVKRHEYHCGACMMAVPMQSGVALLTGQFTNCPNCQCILYLSAESAEAITPSSKR
jgi:predicted  nucleic acid-binding Zn-ribbon protein